MSNLNISLTENEANIIVDLLGEVEALAALGTVFPDIDAIVAPVGCSLIDVRDKIEVARKNADFDCVIEYYNGNRWVFLMNAKRFWEPRRFKNRQEAYAVIADAKSTGPGFYKYRIASA